MQGHELANLEGVEEPACSDLIARGPDQQLMLIRVFGF
jgi:hypothetical protein